MPLSLGSSLTILSLGSIVTDRPNFHSQAYIWPVGFRSKRMYASSVRPHARVAYICEILDGGSAPEFRLTADDDKDNPISGQQPSVLECLVLPSDFSSSSLIQTPNEAALALLSLL